MSIERENTVSGQTLDNVAVPFGVTLTIQSSTTVNLNGHYLKSTGGTIIDNGANWNPNITNENGHYATIQSAINDAALYGYPTTVDVGPGTYNEQVVMKEDVDLWAVDYLLPGNTVIDVGLGYTTAVTFDGIANARVRGFTLRGYAAVYCSDSSSPASFGNVIWGCVLNDSENGVYCYDSSPRLKGTLITDCTYGLMLYNSSNPNVSERDGYGYNTINGDGQGVRCISGSVPELGVFSPGNWGQNQIWTSGYDIYISSSNPEALTIYAQKNWWGPDEEEPLIYYGKPSWNVIWEPMLAKIVASRSENPEVEQYRSSSLLLSKGEYPEAIAGFKGVIEGYPCSNAAEASLTELIFAYREMGAEGECLAYLEETARMHSDTSLGGVALRASVSVLRRLGLGQKALERVSELLEKFKGTQWERDLFFSKGMIYKHNLKAHEKATAVFEEFVRSYPEDIVADFARLELGYDPPQLGSEEAGEQVISGVDLLQSCPNPFNAQTAISFALPKSVFVRLEVYNTLGQRVRTVVESQMKAGEHSIIWDGRDQAGREISSGVYLVRLSGDSGGVQTRKIMLLR
ncbi:MAG: FlgD immunoglobulin-like domain containing protein [Candidatus Latescibacterota bacterium]